MVSEFPFYEIIIEEGIPKNRPKSVRNLWIEAVEKIAVELLFASEEIREIIGKISLVDTWICSGIFTDKTLMSEAPAIVSNFG